MRRLLAPAVAALAAAAPAAAHGPGGPHAGYVSTVSEIRPNVLGLQATVLDGDRRLLVRNWSGKTVVLLGPSGAPLLRFDERGVARLSDGRWRRVAAGTSFGWHDDRIGWSAAHPPDAVRRDPGSPHYIRAWRIPGTADGRRFAIRGLLGYAPPPGAGDGSSAWPWRAAALGALCAVAAAVALLGARRRLRPGPDGSRPTPAAPDRPTE